MTAIALRIDVDTFRGTRDGVPKLLETLAKHDVRATFYFSVGPDNMGRHVWRLLRPKFFVKMLRSNAGKLYGWDVLLAGTCWPGRKIGQHLGAIIRAADAAGHEIGLHAWDHHRWQRQAGRLSAEALCAELEPGVELLTELLGRRPDTSAAAGWICNERALEAKQRLGFAYNSDCRGRSVFVPLVDGKEYAPQVPTTMPTYDELIGRHGVTDDNYNERLLGHVDPNGLNVLAIHAEVEGIACAALFDDFLERCSERDLRLMPLGSLDALRNCEARDTIASAPVEGREGDIAWQRSALPQ
jgi:undecaprenyl phosphate-alpha-L-ara4FN deformylase